jgi:hypothetical protein
MNTADTNEDYINYTNRVNSNCAFLEFALRGDDQNADAKLAPDGSL